MIKTAGDIETLARAIRHAADIPGVRVINISVTDCIPVYKDVNQSALGAALHYASEEKDILVVAAAGNTVESCTSNPLAGEPRPQRIHGTGRGHRDLDAVVLAALRPFRRVAQHRGAAIRLQHGRAMGRHRRPG